MKLVGPGVRLVPTDTEWIRAFHRGHIEWRRTLAGGPNTGLVDRIRSASRDSLEATDPADSATPAIEAGPGPGSERDVAVAVPFRADIYEVIAP